VGRYRGELVRLVPELSDRLPGLPPPLHSDPETERFRLFDAVASWFAAASAEQPVLLVLDDLQWGAKPTLLLLRHVARSPERMRVLVIGTYRDSELGRTHALTEVLADLRRDDAIERISLAGLKQPDVAAYMSQAAGYVLDQDAADLARAIHTETEGNPFFVVEVLRHLAETGALHQRDGRWMTGPPVERMAIPAGIREVVGRRLSRLSDGANQALALAAVVGQEFDLAVLHAAAGIDEEPLIAALEEGVAARLLFEVPGGALRHRFAHALVRATLYDELSAARRVLLHRRAGEAIEKIHAGRLDEHLPALVHHFARSVAPSADGLKAVGYAVRAGDRALGQLAHDEAVSYYRQALELLEITPTAGEEDQRLDLLVSLGEAQHSTGEPAYRETLLEAARLAASRGDACRLARAALANSRGGMFSSTNSVDEERVAVLEAALDAMDGSDLATRARLLANLGIELVWALDRDQAALSNEALGLARRLGDQATLAHVLRRRWVTIASPATRATRSRRPSWRFLRGSPGPRSAGPCSPSSTRSSTGMTRRDTSLRGSPPPASSTSRGT
jgi:predicted ATPase